MTVFFDLDKTLLDVNSGSEWLRHEFAAGRVSIWQTVQALVWLLFYHFFGSDMTKPLRLAMQSLKGIKESEIIERSDAFYESHMSGHLRPGARKALEHHRSQGHTLVLLTSSSSYLARKVSEDLKLDGHLATTLGVDDAGFLTGEPGGTICFGGGKVVLAQGFLDAHGGSLDDCVFYTDSYSDLPMMEAASEAVAVNPDPRLRKEAERRGWRICDWGRAPGTT
jgi:HAD superfamily hydrolase (TIGR01490 family)